MRGALILAGFMLVSRTALAVDEIEPLDGAFLEYLANMEADGDDWTLLADATDKSEPDTDGNEDQAVETRKPTKEPAKPAGEKQ